MRTAILKKRQLLSITPNICLGDSSLPAFIKHVSNCKQQSDPDDSLPKRHREHQSIAGVPFDQLQSCKACCQKPAAASDTVQSSPQHITTAAATAAQLHCSTDAWSFTRAQIPMAAVPSRSAQPRHDRVNPETELQTQTRQAGWISYRGSLLLKQPKLQQTRHRSLCSSSVVEQSRLSTPSVNWSDLRHISAHSTVEAGRHSCLAKSLSLLASLQSYSTSKDAKGSAAAKPQSANSQSASDARTPSTVSDGTKIVLYKGSYMRLFRLLVRFKIFQLVGIAALAIPINTFLAEVCHMPLLREKNKKEKRASDAYAIGHQNGRVCDWKQPSACRNASHLQITELQSLDAVCLCWNASHLWTTKL